MASSEAKYFHSTPYKFELQARQAVITDFCAAVKDVSAKCWYDLAQNIFCLTCPTATGQDTDEALWKAISKYVQTEMTAAERENRLSKVRLFPEFSVDVTEDPLDAAPTEPTSSYNITSASKLVVVHDVAVETSSNGLVKFFKLRDLPEGVLERGLAPKNAKSTKVFANSMTCRVTRWSTSRRDHVFNGRVGTPIMTNNDTESDVLCSNTFLFINNQGQGHEDAKELSKVPIKQWRFIGDVPSVQQWREGMGETEPFDPEYMPAPPKDAEKFMHKPIYSMHALGRVRMPEPTAAVHDSSEEEDSEEEGNQPTFAKLLGQKGGSREHERPEQDVSEPVEKKEGLRSFAGLLGRGETTGKAPQQAPPPQNVPTTMVAIGAAPTNHKSQSTALSPSLGPNEIGSSKIGFDQNAYFPTGNQYAKVDEAGLTSNAANQARWEHANPSPRKPKSNRSGIAFRGSQASAMSSHGPTSSSTDTTMSQTTGRDPPFSYSPPSADNSNSLMFNASTMPSYTDVKSDARDWTNKVNRQTAPQKMLIDDSALTKSALVKKPPGLEFGPHNRGQQNKPLQTIQQRPSEGRPVQQKSEYLIDLSDCESKNTRTSVKLPTMATLTPTNGSNQFSSNSATSQDIDTIQERLQPVVSNTNSKRNTMRQKASKRGKQSKSSSRKNGKPGAVADLPKPDPPPPPKRSYATQPPNSRGPSNALNVTAGSSKITPPAAIEHVTENAFEAEQAGDCPQVEPVNGLEKLLQGIPPDTDMNEIELTIQFGFILSRHLTDKTFLNGAYAPEKIERKLQDAGPDLHTVFFPRMTTSDDDARFLLSLVDPDSLRAKVEYEILVKTSEGESRLVTFDQTSVNDFQVSRTDNVLGKLFMHRPMRVWDAQATIQRPEIDADIRGSVRKFIKSLQTIEHPPSFLAVVPSHLYAVEKVYAKRIFVKTLGNVEVQVMEVQDLSLSAIDANGYNFKASASSKDGMIDDQRLWWELQLHVVSVELVSTTELQTMVEEFVGKIDGIGFWNNGPFERKEVEALPERSVAEIPFW